MNNKVIYTSLTGNYDNLKNPEYIMEGWDYICFSNDWIPPQNSVWKVKPIPSIVKDQLRLSRFAKLNPHLLLPEYEYSFWIDSNIVIVDNSLEDLINSLIAKKTNLSIPEHIYRDCIYEEAEACINDGRDSKNIIMDQMEFLRQNKFPKNQGLFENNLIFRKHNHPEIMKLCRQWWTIYCTYSKRDQLSLVYLLWKNNIVCEPMFAKGVSARTYEGVKYFKHSPSHYERIKAKIRKQVNRYNIFDK